MPKRQNTLRVAADEVQGEGSYVVLRKMSWERQQEAQKLLAEAAGGTLPSQVQNVPMTLEFLRTNVDFTREMLRENVVEWNWVDDDGRPLPLPKDEAAQKLLSSEEVQFLAKALQQRADEKN